MLFLQKPRATFPLIIGVAIAVIGASFQYGYNIAVVNAPADVNAVLLDFSVTLMTRKISILKMFSINVI